MKRKMMILCFVSVLLLAFSSPAWASDVPDAGAVSLVTDGAGLLSASELRRLNEQAEAVSDEYDCAVVVFTVQDMGGEDIFDYGYRLYETYDLGRGRGKSCAMLLVSMQERDFAFLAFGGAETAFTPYAQEQLEGKFLPDLSEGSYYANFRTYIETCGVYLGYAESGAPLQANNVPANAASRFWENAFMIFVVPLLVALLICLIALRKMKTAVPQRAAQAYIPQGGFRLTAKQDVFSHRTETRVTIQTENKSSSGGTKSDSRGFSGRSGKF